MLSKPDLEAGAWLVRPSISRVSPTSANSHRAPSRESPISVTDRFPKRGDDGSLFLRDYCL